MNIDFISSGPAVLIEEEERILFIADIHMGIETDLKNHGIYIKSHGKERVQRLVNCIRETSPDKLVILGDIKHRIPGTSWQEFSELPHLFSILREILPFFVTPGNHDPGIEGFLRDNEYLIKEGDIIDQVGVLHGHTKLNPALKDRLILCGHHHPTVSMSDEVGIALRSPCFIIGELGSEIFDEYQEDENKNTRVLMVPSFNELTGYGIEKTFRTPFSPISRAMIIDTAECLLPDGTYAGDLKTLINYDNNYSP